MAKASSSSSPKEDSEMPLWFGCKALLPMPFNTPSLQVEVPYPQWLDANVDRVSMASTLVEASDKPPVFGGKVLLPMQ